MSQGQNVLAPESSLGLLEFTCSSAREHARCPTAGLALVLELWGPAGGSSAACVFVCVHVCTYVFAVHPSACALGD